MRNRQINLDFHTSEHIDGIGSRFSKENFQQALTVGHIDSITVFAKCHHGWAYHETEVNKMHPHLKFDLLAAQIEAAHEIGVKTPVYISVGYDERALREHEDWRMWTKEDYDAQRCPTMESAMFHYACFNSEYIDYLMAEIEEVVKNYDADGIFLDIVSPHECYCPKCCAELEARGGKVGNLKDMLEFGEEVFERYYNRAREVVDKIKPGLPIFHNAGHVYRGRRDLMHHISHFEIESLPSGGWGYDNLPITAAYVRNFDKEFLSMTGKFHGTWGEFGGYKHTNALIYETALALANNAGCSVGDQLHPDGEMDLVTYKMIGKAYERVEKISKIQQGARNVADIGVLSAEAAYWHYKTIDFGFDDPGYQESDTGAVRILNEGHYLFDFLDFDSDFSGYKLIILPDRIRLDGEIKLKLENYLKQGGKLLMSGSSGLLNNKDEFFGDFGISFKGKSEFSPVYTVPKFTFGEIGNTAYVTYAKAYNIEADGKISIADRENPYFNRTSEHFCSHQHAPNNKNAVGSTAVINGNVAYIGINIFEEYAKTGCIFAKDFVRYVLEEMVEKSLKCDIPSQGTATMLRKSDAEFVHLVYTPIVKRGDGIEVIEDIVPLYNVDCTVRTEIERVSEVKLMPDGKKIEFTQKDGKLCFTVPRVDCHAVIEIR